MINALFVCGRNKLRSPTAARVFAAWPNVETDSAGLNPDAQTPLGPDLIAWADIILVMEPRQRTKLASNFVAIWPASVSSASTFQIDMPSCSPNL